MSDKKRGLSGLYILLVLFAVMILFGGPAIVRMINIILFGQCNVAPEANKMKAAIEEVCRGAIGDSKQVDYPSCPVFMKCDNCATASGKAIFRSALGVAQAKLFVRSVTATAKSFWKAPRTVGNVKNFISDFKSALSDGKWKSVGNWWSAYSRAEGAGTYRSMLKQGRLVTAKDISTWGRVASYSNQLYNTAKTTLLGTSALTGSVNLVKRSPATMIYYLVAIDPNKPDIQNKVEGLTNDVMSRIEPILTDQAGTLLMPIGLDVYMKVMKNADADGRLEKLALGGLEADGKAHALLFELNTKLMVLFTGVDDQIYANAQFGQDSCMQPSSTAFNTIPSSNEEVAGACTFTSTVATLEPQDCDPASADFHKCANPSTFAEQNEMVELSANVFLRRNHVFRFLEDVHGFLLSNAAAAEKKALEPEGKAAIIAARTNIDAILIDAKETASRADDPWSIAYVAFGRIAENVAKIAQYEDAASSASLLGWYGSAIDTMNSIDELISGRWSYKTDSDGNPVRDALLDDGLEQKHIALLKIRNEAFDVLANAGASCETKSVESDDGKAKITVPLCALISSCNHDDRLHSSTSGCILGAPNLEKSRAVVTVCAGGERCDAAHAQIGESYFSLPAVPITPIDYGTTLGSLEVPIGLVSGLIGGEAGKAIATYQFATANCPNPAGALVGGEKPANTLLFCMKPASPQCVLPGGCEVCFAAKCNTPVICSSVGAANLRIEKKRCEGGETIAFPLSYCPAGEAITELTGPVKPI